MFRSARAGFKSIPYISSLEGISATKICPIASYKLTKNLTRKPPTTLIRTLKNQADDYDSESRLESFLKKGIVPYPNFTFLSDGKLDIDSLKDSSSHLEASSPSSGYTVTTLRELQNEPSKNDSSSKNSLPFNDLPTLRARYSNLEPGARLKDTTMVLAGLVGFVGKSNAGELTIFATSAPQLLAPCLPVLPLPTQLGTLEQRFRRRPLALLLHEPTIKAVKMRAKVLQGIRRYLDARGFLEVETPILAVQAGGAAAKPFTTHCRALDSSLHLRISPELYLKQMVVGGFDRVYELGRVFRNESIDPSHNPEFTTCEFYLAYANLETLFQMTEELVGTLVQDAIGSLNVETSEGAINFQAPFARIHVVDELARQLGPLPSFDGPVEPWLDLCNLRNIKVPAPLTTTRVLDALIGALIEPACTQPTFLFGHPLVMSPLAKSTSSSSKLSARFELFIGKREVINAYEELNSPSEQIDRFNAQLKDRASGDAEAHEPNQDFCDALSYGLPPTAGWGLGVDRLVSLLSNSPNIRSTLTFPILRSLRSDDN